MFKCIVFYLQLQTSLAIRGGSLASEGQFPFMARLLITNVTKEEPQRVLDLYQCGNTILSSLILLTAAHCVDRVNLSQPDEFIHVTVGVANTHLRSNPWRQERRVQKILIHSDYTETQMLSFDGIALLILSKPLNLTTAFVSPIKIPAPGQQFKGDAITCGWGRTEYSSSPSKMLRISKVEIVEWMGRRRRIDKDPDALVLISANGVPLNEEASQIYTTNSKGSRPCPGDSGGPLVCYTHPGGEPYQCGIVSLATRSSCVYTAHSLTVFTSVARYADWIQSKMNEYDEANHFRPDPLLILYVATFISLVASIPLLWLEVRVARAQK